MHSDYTFIPSAGDNIICTFYNKTNTPRLTINSISLGKTAGFTYSAANSNGNGFSSQTLTTTAVNTPVTGTTQFLSLPATLTQVQQTSPTGWTLSSVSCQDNNAASTGNVTGPNIGYITGNVLTIPAANTLAGADLQCTFTNTYSGNTITGKVILDNGAGGGTAQNGIQDGNETARSGVTLTLTNCAGTNYASASTDSSGNFSFSTNGITAGAVCIVKATAPGYTPVSSNAGTTGGTYTAATDTFTFTEAANTNYSGIVLGEVGLSSFTLSGTQQQAAGLSAVYSHTYTAGTAASVSFSTSSTLLPAGLQWTTLLYLDTGCTGTLAAGDTIITGATTVTAGQTICILVKVTSPSGASLGAENISTITATETLTPTPTTGSTIHNLSNTDTTSVATPGLTLTKQVRILAACPTTAAASLANSAAYSNGAPAQPGQMAQYLLTYNNSSVGPLTKIKIDDATPAYTNFQYAYCLTTPAGLSNCAVTTQPAFGSSGSLQFTLTDASSNPIGLSPGASGTVSFCVQVVP